VVSFVDCYNHQHRHSGIKFVTPHQRHSGHAVERCRHRADVYAKARPELPRRWSRSTRGWRQPEVVWINKPPDEPQSALAVPLAEAAWLEEQPKSDNFPESHRA
jgi:putative transposase